MNETAGLEELPRHSTNLEVLEAGGYDCWPGCSFKVTWRVLCMLCMWLVAPVLVTQRCQWDPPWQQLSGVCPCEAPNLTARQMVMVCYDGQGSGKARQTPLKADQCGWHVFSPYLKYRRLGHEFPQSFVGYDLRLCRELPRACHPPSTTCSSSAGAEHRHSGTCGTWDISLTAIVGGDTTWSFNGPCSHLEKQEPANSRPGLPELGFPKLQGEVEAQQRNMKTSCPSSHSVGVKRQRTRQNHTRHGVDGVEGVDLQDQSKCWRTHILDFDIFLRETM